MLRRYFYISPKTKMYTTCPAPKNMCPNLQTCDFTMAYQRETRRGKLSFQFLFFFVKKNSRTNWKVSNRNQICVMIWPQSLSLSRLPPLSVNHENEENKKKQNNKPYREGGFIPSTFEVKFSLFTLLISSSFAKPAASFTDWLGWKINQFKRATCESFVLGDPTCYPSKSQKKKKLTPWFKMESIQRQECAQMRFEK